MVTKQFAGLAQVVTDLYWNGIVLKLDLSRNFERVEVRTKTLERNVRSGANLQAHAGHAWNHESSESWRT